MEFPQDPAGELPTEFCKLFHSLVGEQLGWEPFAIAIPQDEPFGPTECLFQMLSASAGHITSLWVIRTEEELRQYFIHALSIPGKSRRQGDYVLSVYYGYHLGTHEDAVVVTNSKISLLQEELLRKQAKAVRTSLQTHADNPLFRN